MGILERLSSGLKEESEFSRYACVTCVDTGWVVTPGTPAKRCDCAKRAQRERLLGKIPAEYRNLDLATVQPDITKHFKQTALLQAVKSDPDASLFLAGRNGSGKSMVGWLLFKRAIEQGRPAVFLSMPELLREFREWEMDSVKYPSIDASTLRETKSRWFIGIDEAGNLTSTYLINLVNDDVNQHVWNSSYPQYGLCLKTYQSDIFNNWIQTDWIDGENGINEITAIDTSGGEFKRSEERSCRERV